MIENSFFGVKRTFSFLSFHVGRYLLFFFYFKVFFFLRIPFFFRRRKLVNGPGNFVQNLQQEFLQ